MHSRKRLSATQKHESSNFMTNRGPLIQRRSKKDSGGLTSSHILQMQKAYGNQGVMQMLRDKQTIQRMPDSKTVTGTISNKLQKGKITLNPMKAYKPILTKLDLFNSFVNRTNVGRSAQAIRFQLERVKLLYKNIETEIQTFLDQYPTGATAQFFKNLRGQLIKERLEVIRIANFYMQQPPKKEESILWGSLTNSSKHKSIKLTKKQETGKTDKGGLNLVKFFSVGKDEGVFKETTNTTLTKEEFKQQNPNATEEAATHADNERVTTDTAGIDSHNAHMAERNVAMSRLNDLLGLNVIARAELAIYKSSDGTKTQGSFMKKAKGKQGVKLSGQYSTTKESSSGESPFVFDSNLQRYMSQLQLLDTLAMQIDRHDGNFFIDYDKEGNVTSVTGIDNDMAFGNIEDIDKRIKSFPALSKFVEKELAERILSLHDDDLITVMEDLLAPSEVTALLTRLHKLQSHLQILKNNNELLSPDQWNEATARGMLEEQYNNEDTTKGNYYAKIVSANEDDAKKRKNAHLTNISFIIQGREDLLKHLPKKELKKLKTEVEKLKKAVIPLIKQGMDDNEIVNLTNCLPSQVKTIRQILNK